MSPTYEHMQIVVLDRHNRIFHEGDVVAFYCDGLSSVLVKRVVAGPKDTAQIVDGTLLVNGQVSKVITDVGVITNPGILEEPLSLGIEQYLVLGDNLQESKDSRYIEVGIVAEDKIYGKVCNHD